MTGTRTPRRLWALVSGSPRAALLAGLSAIAAGGAVLRCLYWPQVFTPRGVRFLFDPDPHYHVLRAERILQAAPGAPWFDGGLTFPSGATILWPPLFDYLVAWTARIFAGPAPDRAGLEVVAALVPVAIGTLTILAVAAAAGTLWGSRGAVLSAICTAAVPGSLEVGGVGRPDQHVLEVLVFACLLALLVRCGGEGAGRRRILLAGATGALLALAFWTWQGSGLVLVYLGVVAAAWALLPAGLAPSAVIALRALALAGGAGAILLLGSVALWGRAGALQAATANSVGGFHVALLASFAAAAALLWLVRARAERPGRALGAAAAAVAVLAAGIAAAAPEMGAGAWRILSAFFLDHPVYTSLGELTPLLFSGLDPAWLEAKVAAVRFGPLFLMPIAAIPSFRRTWRDRPEVRVPLTLLAVGCVLFFVLTLYRARFGVYLVPFLSLSGALALAPPAGAAPRRPSRAGVLAVLTVLGLGWAVFTHADVDRRPFGPADEEVIHTLRTLGSFEPASADAPAVVGDWNYGHHVQYYAGKPVLVTPFIEDLEPDGMSEWIRFLFARDEADAEAVLRGARAGFVLASHPLGAYAYLEPLAPPEARVGARRTKSVLDGESLAVSETALELLTSRLFFFDGMSRSGGSHAALGGFRLLHESRDTTPEDGYDGLKVFGVVPGAHVEVGTAPLGRVSAVVRVVTNQRRTFEWRTWATADSAGKALLRVPYATGRNGNVRASACTVSASGASTELILAPDLVERGGRLALRLAADG